jgi:predicted short-subunit dehydrogenase-like oxidoreductase (DUF2520 family)
MNSIPYKRIAMIGAGNVAWHLAPALVAVGHAVTAIYSQNPSSREALAKQLPQAQPISTLNLQHMAVDVVVLAVPDAALAGVAAELEVAPGTIVVHTSGSQPLALLQPIQGAHIGVFYPLQTFSKSKPVDFANVPLLVEAQDQETLQPIEQLARSISQKVQQVSSEARKQLHLAAVFACNFTNHLLGISQQLLQEANLPKELLHPLIEETIEKALRQNPFSVQTGPAVRGDENVLQAHLHMLQPHPRYQAIYNQLSKSIQAQASDKEPSKRPE